jgi:hypothetical protein
MNVGEQTQMPLFETSDNEKSGDGIPSGFKTLVPVG